MNHGTLTGYQHHKCRCDACRKTNREYKATLRPRYRQKLNKANRERIAERTQWLHSLNTPCVDCGNKFHPVSMDYDHVRGVKLFNIAQNGFSKEATLAEIEKCDLVCANCHRYRTHCRKLYMNGTITVIDGGSLLPHHLETMN